MNTAPTNPEPVEMQLGLSALGAVLVKHFGLHEGLYNLAVELQIAAGAVGPDAGPKLPGAIIGISSIGLTPTATPGPLTIDAKLVNPAKTRSKKPSE